MCVHDETHSFLDGAEGGLGKDNLYIWGCGCCLGEAKKMELEGKLNGNEIYYDAVQKITIECQIDNVKETIVYEEVNE